MDEKNILLLSDSIWKYLPSRDERYTNLYINCHSIRGARIGDLFEQAEGGTFDYVILHVGTNDLSHYKPGTWCDLLNSHMSLVQRIREIHQCPIFVSSVLPRIDSDHIQELIKQYNIDLSTLVGKYRQKTGFDVRFLEWSSIFRPSMEYLFSKDGLHPSKIGNAFAHKMLYDRLSWEIGPTCSELRLKQSKREFDHLMAKRRHYQKLRSVKLSRNRVVIKKNHKRSTRKYNCNRDNVKVEKHAQNESIHRCKIFPKMIEVAMNDHVSVLLPPEKLHIIRKSEVS